MRIFAYATQKGGVEKWLVLLKRKARKRNKQLDSFFVDKEKGRIFTYTALFKLTF